MLKIAGSLIGRRPIVLLSSLLKWVIDTETGSYRHLGVIKVQYVTNDQVWIPSLNSEPDLYPCGVAERVVGV